MTDPYPIAVTANRRIHAPADRLWALRVTPALKRDRWGISEGGDLFEGLTEPWAGGRIARGSRGMTLLTLGATGTIGRALVQGALDRGHAVTAQTRRAQPGFPAGVTPAVFDPASTPDLCCPHLGGQDAVIYALGFRGRGPVRFFPDATCSLLAAMQATGVRRLVAITGVGAGETKGQGGFLYEHLIHPVVTQAIHADKDREEDLIRAGDTDWTILRPAPFRSAPGREPFHGVTEVRPGTRLSRVMPSEVARLAPDCAEKGLHRGDAVFFGHGVAG